MTFAPNDPRSFRSSAGGSSSQLQAGAIYIADVKEVAATTSNSKKSGQAKLRVRYLNIDLPYTTVANQSPTNPLVKGDSVLISFLHNQFREAVVLGKLDNELNNFIPIEDTDGKGGKREAFKGPLRGDDGTGTDPTYSFSADPAGYGCGMWRSTLANNDDTLHFSVSGTEAIRIGQDSNSSYGTVWFTDSYLQVQGIYPWANATYDIGWASNAFRNIYATSDFYGPNQYINTSDENLKTDILDSTLGLGFVLDLRPVSYKWIDTGDGDPGVRTHHGFVAQEVETLLGADASTTAMWINQEIPAQDEQPAMMHVNGVDEIRAAIPATEARTEQGLRYGELIAPMVKAIQELSAKLEIAEARIAVLEG